MIRNPSIQAALRDAANNQVFNLVGEGSPISGESGTGRGVAGIGSTYTNLSNGVRYFNEGTPLCPYWTPISMLQPGLLAWFTDFRDGLGKALADTAATATISGSGVRVFGDGIAETDSGLVVAIGEDGAIASLTTTDEANHVAA